ncbi:universal stress protein [Natrialba aegyptia]|uniref:UspA domain-containing protein n=1 Tax=Natrialba aegyptia DSM 13077 TaxID=1227491 RepID=M0AG29_9EURY|nr:universal stress protein [Natrialba aegyptia]ELY97690.1 UspA domain-containing protein [Natrialba aegyptia DSM 13077]
MSATILVAFDDSPQATAALRHALSTYDDAVIRVLYVNDPRQWAGSDGIDGIFSVEKAFERSQEAANEIVAVATEIAAEYDAEITTAIEVGTVAETIITDAEDHDIDHIVLGSHGRRGLRRFLLGSVAQRVVRRSPSSVTVIREGTPTTD